MQTESAHFPATPIALKMGVAIGIGMLAGMEREWSNKDVGINIRYRFLARHALFARGAKRRGRGLGRRALAGCRHEHT